MKWLLFPVTAVVILLGIYFGLQDHRARQNDPSNPAPAAGDTPSLPGTGDPDEPGAALDEEPEPPAPALDREALEAAVTAGLEEQDRLVRDRQLVAARNFLGERIESLIDENAEALRARPEDLELLAPLRRARLKLSVFEEVREREGLEEIPSTLYRVRLHNGNDMIASEARREGGKVQVTLFPSGIAFSRQESDVASVENLPGLQFQVEEWKRLLERLKESARDPIDLYIKGVVKCLKLGLEREACLLLGKVLDSSDPVSVLEIVFADAGDEFHRQWLQAAGREDLDPVTGISPEPDPVTVAREGGSGGDSPPSSTTPSRPRVVEAPPELAERLESIHSLKEKARTIYREVIQGGDMARLEKARADLEKARSLLNDLPPELEAVQRTRSEVYLLLHAVIKAQPL